MGSAVGLGNVWRFPYITGQYGGAAFILLYIGCVLAIGIPIMLAEFVIGRRTERTPVGAFKALAPGSAWVVVGALSSPGVPTPSLRSVSDAAPGPLIRPTPTDEQPSQLGHRMEVGFDCLLALVQALSAQRVFDPIELWETAPFLPE